MGGDLKALFGEPELRGGGSGPFVRRAGPDGLAPAVLSISTRAARGR